jgi:hypothetical protein
MAALAAVFGAATVTAGGRVLLGGEAARDGAGHYVPFVLWFNFLAGFAYLGAAAGIALWRHWAVALSAAIAAATLAVGLAFAAHLLAGGAFERRTVVALAFRLGVWTVIAVLLHQRLGPAQGHDGH